jgi:hypothetical protein
MFKLMLRDQSWIWVTRSIQETASDLLYLGTQTEKDIENWDFIWNLENRVPMPLPEQGGGSSEVNGAIAATQGQKKALNAGDAWLRMLLIIPGMTKVMVDEFRVRYGTLREWIHACETRDLVELCEEIGNISTGKRRWGPSIAEKLVTYFGYEIPLESRKGRNKSRKN